jgi:hypothetical protein
MKIIKLKGYKYELAETMTVHVPDIVINTRYVTVPYITLFYDGTLKIYAGYHWDGASGIPDNPDNMRASLFHDALYQLMRKGLLDRKYKDVADKLFRDICIIDGMSKNWADFIYDGLKKFGDAATKPNKHPKGQVIEI